ncbi:MAG: Non-ribosomal peptide synthetase component [Pedosphaera sp.]|nr:Non-ribosomal peptide synthetase component [Pedosphaera sp.]
MGCTQQYTSETYALAPMQQGMLFNRLLAEHSGVDIEQIVFELREDLKESAFETAWRRIIRRHKIFRTSFHWEGLERPVQKVHEEVPFPFEYKDWRNSSTAEQTSRFEALLKAERRRGFDLGTPPLMRLVLCRLGQSQFRLVWTFDHTLIDGRSFTLVIKEVFAIYESLRQGREPELEPVRPYCDYIKWLEQQNSSKSEGYWRSLLEGVTAPTALVIDQMINEVTANEPNYGEHFLRILKPLTAELQQFATSHKVTLNTLVQGAWALLLSRYSGETDVVFGATRAGRKSTIEGADSMIGLFINTLPVRVRLEPETSLLPWLQELRAQQLKIRDHEHTPLVQVQQWSQVPNGTPLFESLVVFERGTLDSVLRAQGGAWLNRHFRVVDQTNYPLTLFAYEAEELTFKISYDRRRLGADAVARLATHLETLLGGMVTNPHQKLSTIPLLPAAERQQLLVEWNRTGRDYLTDCCLREALEARVPITPEAIALVCGDEQLTYRELDARANRLAQCLRSFGVGPEVLVGVCLEVSLEMIIALVAVLKAGGAYVPLDPAYPKERLTFMLEDSRSPVLLTQHKFKDMFPGSNARIICLDNGEAEPEIRQPESVEVPGNKATPDNLAYVLYTSGSTGQPKGVMVTHRNILNFFAGMDQCLGKKSGVWLAVTSISFDISVLELFWTLTRGFKVVLQRREENLVTAIARQITTHAVTHLQCTPSMAEMLVRDGAARQALHSLKQLLLGGEALSPELVKQLDIPGEILNMYGPTETTIWSIVHKLNRREDRIPIGRPIANTEIYILDAHLQPMPIGVPGELFIGGVGVVRGYFERKELTAEKFIANPFKSPPHARLFKTGDRARYLADGSIEFLGRLDYQVKLRGFRIELGEIESTLRQHPDVRECVVAVREFAPRDTRLVAYVVALARSAGTIRSLREFLKQKLPDYMLPSAFVLLDTFPLTPNGKINRRALPAPERELQPEAVVAPPRSTTEKILAQIWLGVLGRKEIGIHDNFFEQGGHSLLAMQAVSQMQVALKINLSIVQLYQHPTIHTLARFLSRPATMRQSSKIDPGRTTPGKQVWWPRRNSQLRPPVQRAGHNQACRSNGNPKTPSLCPPPEAITASSRPSQPD